MPLPLPEDITESLRLYSVTRAYERVRDECRAGPLVMLSVEFIGRVESQTQHHLNIIASVLEGRHVDLHHIAKEDAEIAVHTARTIVPYIPR